MTVAPASVVRHAGWSVWAWPVVAAALAAWPVWRSLFPETPDVLIGPLPAEIVLAAAALLLTGLWVARFRNRLARFGVPMLGIAVAAIVGGMAHRAGDSEVADLAALALVWLVAALTFAGAIQLHGQEQMASRHRGPVAAAFILHRGHEMIAMWLMGIGLLFAAWQGPLWGFLFSAVAVSSPGAILAWASLCDTARTILARRKAHINELDGLPALTMRRHIIFDSPDMVLADRLKVTTILPATGIKPGDIVSLATGLLADDSGPWSLAVQDFGVSHRVRVPTLKMLEASAPTHHRGKLGDKRVVEIGLQSEASATEAELEPFAETIARATELHRPILALTEVEPTRQLLGLLVLGRVSRPGATETVRTLRQAGFTVELAGGAIAPEDREALTALALAMPPARRPVGGAIRFVRPGEATRDEDVTVHFGGRLHNEGAFDILVAREDPRTLLDLLQFARDFRRRLPISLALASLPGIILVFPVFGLLPVMPLLITVTGVAGVLLAAIAPQVLRASPTAANEVDEE